MMHKPVRCLSTVLIVTGWTLAWNCSASAVPMVQVHADTIALQTTNWSDSVSIPLFDPSLGTLLSIEFELTGNVAGDANFESLDAEPANVSVDISALITLTRPDATKLVSVLPLFSVTEPVDAFDGVIDFGGLSGRQFLGLTANANDTFTSPPPASDLALFTGLGNILLPVSADALSGASGAGNLLTLFQTQAGADVRVTYTYEPNQTEVTVPEPATGVLVGLGCLGLAIRRRRVKRA